MSNQGLAFTTASQLKATRSPAIAEQTAIAVMTTAQAQRLQQAQAVREQLQIIFRNLPSNLVPAAALPSITKHYLQQLESSSSLSHAQFNLLLTQAYSQEMQRRGLVLPAASQQGSLLNQLRSAFTEQLVLGNQATRVRRATQGTGISSARSRRAIDEDSTILYTLITAQIDRLNTYDTELETMVQDMETLTAFLNESRTVLSAMYDGKPNSGATALMPSEAVTFMNSYNLAAPGSTTQLSDTQYQNYITSVESLVEQNNNESQLQIFQLQQVVGYRNQVYELITNTFSRVIRLYDTIISNFKV